MYLNWDGEGKAEAFGPALDLTPHQAGRRPSASVKCIHALHAGRSTRRATLRLFCFTNWAEYSPEVSAICFLPTSAIMLVILMIQFNYCEKPMKHEWKKNRSSCSCENQSGTLWRGSGRTRHTQRNIAVELVWERQAERNGWKAGVSQSVTLCPYVPGPLYVSWNRWADSSAECSPCIVGPWIPTPALQNKKINKSQDLKTIPVNINCQLPKYPLHLNMPDTQWGHDKYLWSQWIVGTIKARKTR